MPGEGKKDLPLDERERVRDAMKRYLRDECGGNKAELGRRLGLSRIAVLRNTQGLDGPSHDTAEKMAKLLGVDERDLRRGTIGRSTVRTTDTDLPWPRMAPAIAMARDLKYDERAIQTFVATPPKNIDADTDADTIWAMLRFWYEERWMPQNLLDAQDDTVVEPRIHERTETGVSEPPRHRSKRRVGEK